MNTIIQKCIDELNKDGHSIDYVRGMLESMLVMNPALPATTGAIRLAPPVFPAAAKPPVFDPLSDEEKSVVDLYEGGKIGKVA